MATLRPKYVGTLNFDSFEDGTGCLDVSDYRRPLSSSFRSILDSLRTSSSTWPANRESRSSPRDAKANTPASRDTDLSVRCRSTTDLEYLFEFINML